MRKYHQKHCGFKQWRKNLHSDYKPMLGLQHWQLFRSFRYSHETQQCLQWLTQGQILNMTDFAVPWFAGIVRCIILQTHWAIVGCMKMVIHNVDAQHRTAPSIWISCRDTRHVVVRYCHNRWRWCDYEAGWHAIYQRYLASLSNLPFIITYGN